MKTHLLLALTALVAIVFISPSCVSTRKYNALASRCADEGAALTGKMDALKTKLTELEAQYARINKENTQLKADTARVGGMLRVVTADYEELDRSMDALKAKYKEGSEESEEIMGDLKAAQDDLQAREEKLKLLQDELDQKGQTLFELQKALYKKDSITMALRSAVANALTGFEGKGLTVHTHDGKVYVSMEEKLLFASGKWDVSPQGVSALKELAGVLEQQPDINVLIEGHTDNDPLTGQNQVKDNWDLSVMRATSIVKILLQSAKIEPKRLVASGRGEFLPVVSNSSSTNKAKNRRTEIILSPRLDELMRIVGQE